jgi:hypothetical protein
MVRFSEREILFLRPHGFKPTDDCQAAAYVTSEMHVVAIHKLGPRVSDEDYMFKVYWMVPSGVMLESYREEYYNDLSLAVEDGKAKVGMIKPVIRKMEPC